MDRRHFLALGAAFALILPASIRSTSVSVRDLYNDDLSFSDLARDLEGKRISVSGFMAPLLKAEENFFVLTKAPVADCPFCAIFAEWPDDFLAVYTKRVVEVVPSNVEIVTKGVLELGMYQDAETGFRSRVRLANATYS
ncbi:MAG: hypothetical protein AAF566_09170 [Pseudomonadota bacterium]